MAAQAALEAIKDSGLQSKEIQLILNASGTPERCIPDNSALIQEHMGLSSFGIPAFSIHATCLSFLVALEVASSLIENGIYENCLIVSSELVSQYSLDFSNDPYTAALFGDAAAAVVIAKTPSGESSKLSLFRMETYGHLKDLATLRGGGSMWHPADPKSTKDHEIFKMNGPGIMEFAATELPGFLGRMQLPNGLESIDWIISHQPSGHGMSLLQHGMGLGEKVVRIFDTLGNGISTSIPCALYEVIKSGKAKRGHEMVLCGTGAGLSIAAIFLIY